MEPKVKDKSRRNWLVAFSVILCSVLLISACAISTLWSTSTTVTISISSPYIKVMQNIPGGPEVTSINFGNLVPGSQVSTSLIIQNTHPNATIYDINWNSTLGDITNKITDTWGSWPMQLDPGQSQIRNYMIDIASDCPLGTYSWTLYLYPG